MLNPPQHPTSIGVVTGVIGTNFFLPCHFHQMARAVPNCDEKSPENTLGFEYAIILLDLNDLKNSKLERIFIIKGIIISLLKKDTTLLKR